MFKNIDWKEVLRKAWKIAQFVVPIILGGAAGHVCGGQKAEAVVRAQLVAQK